MQYGSVKDCHSALERLSFRCRPAKVNEGVPHPDEIVESALLAHVSPPDISYEHHLKVRVTMCIFFDRTLLLSLGHAVRLC